ncbi:glutathione S-transferase [Pelagibacteraceae bacterium GOM-A3]|nr:glutathione S-transferase [Pelagibacteraceae bacterium GOM-A3]
MIELFTADTPNGWKISIMLEEINFEYKITKVNLSEGEQHKPEFKKISPFNKIPVITDHENSKSIFESGAILMYLGEKSKMFYPKENRLEINQWLMAQMGLIGPMIGQHHQFHYYNQGKSEWGEERYFKITRKLYEDLEARLSQSDYLAGKEYSIADIATWSWIARHKRHDIGLENFKGLSRWYVDIAKRPAVIKGFKVLNKDAEIDYP